MSKTTSPTAGLSATKLELFSLLLEKRGLKKKPPPEIERRGTIDPAPLSFAQERAWNMGQREGRPSFYSFEVKFEGALDVSVLERSIGEVIRRQEVLRTTFESREGQLVQVVNPEQRFSLPMVDVSGLTETDGEVRKLCLEQCKDPFDLMSGPLLRFTLVRLAAESHRLLLTIPHIICDHSSVQLFANEVAALYNAYRQGQLSPLAELSFQYADFARWEREWFKGEVYERELDYWRKQLDGCRPLLQLETDYPRPPIKTFRGTQLLFSLSRDLSEAVQSLAQREQCTLFITLLAGLKTLLYVYTGQPDLIVGTAVAGRTHAGVERIIGNFGTALALRTQLSPDMTFRELLHEVREVSLDAFKHQDISFDRLVEELKPEHDPSYNPLIQVGFVVHTAPVQASVSLDSLKIQISNTHSGRAIFDLNVRMHQTPGGLTGSFEYNTDLFKESTIRRMMDHYINILSGVVANSEQRLADLLPGI
jgi:hypothetical protein